MGKIEAVVKSEVTRLARKEVRAVCGPLGRDVRELKQAVSRLTKIVAALEKVAAEWRQQKQERRAKLEAPDEEVTAARFSPDLIRKLRRRLGLSQKQFAVLVEVSAVAVWSWETGRTRPTKQNKKSLVALRKLGKREVKNVLAQKAPTKPRTEKTGKGRRKARRKTKQKQTA